MSAETDSNTEWIFVGLLSEGTVVYRPVPAVIRGSDEALIIEPLDYDPTDEEWQFKPGTLVRLEERTLDGRKVLVALSQVK